MIKRLLFLLILMSCSPNSSNVQNNTIKLNFDRDLSFNEFNEMLIEYAKKNPYPNIDQ